MKGEWLRGAASSLGRRRFLAALGVTGLSCWTGRAWGGAVSRGAAVAAGRSRLDPSQPLRFIGVFTPHGRAHELWQPGDGFDLRYPGCSLQPFDAPEVYGESFKQQLLVIDGVDLTAGIEVGTVGHDGARVILTGSGANGKNASIDQYLAVEWHLGAETFHTTLSLAVGNDRPELGASLSYGAGGTPAPKLIDPARIFEELFGAPLSGMASQELRAHRVQARSVLDFVRHDLQRWMPQVPAEERHKLEHHGTALREVEKRLEPKRLQCELPARPDAATFPKLRAFGGGEPYFDTITDLHIDLLVRAVACDLTRFATLLLADLTRSGLYPELPKDVHHEVAHRYDARDAERPGNPQSWSLLALQNRHSYGKVARLMQRLREASLLEHVVIYVSSDMGDPAAHSSRQVPTLLAGGCGGAFQMGRYLDLRRQPVPNNRILVSIARAFGIPIERFGHSGRSSTVSGDLSELRG